MTSSIRHKVAIERQGLANCVQFTFASAMRSLGFDASTRSLLDSVPTNHRDNGDPYGTSPAAVATYLLNNYPVKITLLCSDAVVFDYAWRGYSREQISEKLGLIVERINEVPITNITRENIEMYANDYQTYIAAGGNVAIGPVTSKAMSHHLQSGPLVASVAAQHYYSSGGRWYYEDGKQVADSIKGRANTHNIVISGYENDSFFVADPFLGTETPQSFEHITTSIAAGQLESDNAVYCLSV